MDRDETDESCDAMAAGRRLDVTHGLVVGGVVGGSGGGGVVDTRGARG